MTLQHVDILFQLIVFLFAISVHESAHAWMANRRGDPTARMLGRVTLNPIKHIDPVGTVLLPLIAMLTHLPVIGWAKPTPVDPRNFKNPVLDDILTSVVGPISNFVVATGAVLALILVSLTSPLGASIVHAIPLVYPSHLDILASQTDSFLMPISVLFYELMVINIMLGVFNLIPVPPLDGSHVLRHFLPPNALRVYDTLGMFALMALVFLGGGLLGRLIFPVVGVFNYILLRYLMPSGSNQRKRVLSGMRSTGRLHLGNYVGALQNWVIMQDHYECFFFVADWHALTTDYADTSRVKENSIDVLLDWLAAGLDPERCTMFIQSHVPQHAELHLLFSMITPLGWLERVPTYKEQRENITEKDLSTYGFLGYPVLQAADILIYKGDFVPVGEDQVPHVELTREIARRFNHVL